MHPRLKYFPWQQDYINQANRFSPNVMCVSDPGYRSKSLNIDSLGFRHQYDLNRDLIDLKTSRQRYDGCTVLLGNSTSFGVSVSADVKTLGHYLGSDGNPCINLSVRGATMQQELAIFLTYKHLLPKPRKIILLTGICDVSLATQPNDLWSPEGGGMHSVETYYKLHYKSTQAVDSQQNMGKLTFLKWAEERYHKHGWLQRIFEKRIQPEPIVNLTTEYVNGNIEKILTLMNNVIESWGWIAKSADIDIELVLQPVLGWTEKPHSTIEQLCLTADSNRVPAIKYYANSVAYEKVKLSIEKSCVRNNLSFMDSNNYFSTRKSTETLFTDICHLTDNGTKILADWYLQ